MFCYKFYVHVFKACEKKRSGLFVCTSVRPITRITSTIFFVDPIWIVRILSKILNFFFENMGIASKPSIQNFGNLAAGDERLKWSPIRPKVP